ncbi:Uncharacterised protein [Segatella copri]|nr:Uncharacterised protein [Segatella copri]
MEYRGRWCHSSPSKALGFRPDCRCNHNHGAYQ